MTVVSEIQAHVLKLDESVRGGSLIGVTYQEHNRRNYRYSTWPS